MANTCKIYRVSAWLDSRGFDKRIQELEVTETDRSFIANGKRISKSKLNAIDTMFIENHKSIRYSTYCLDGGQQIALNALKRHIVSKAEMYKAEIDVLISYIRQQQ